MLKQWIYDAICDYLEDNNLMDEMPETNKSGIVQWVYEQFAIEVSIVLTTLSQDFCIKTGRCPSEYPGFITLSRLRRIRRLRR